MTLGNPLALGALSFMALPIVIHLMYRRRRKAVRFPSLMFFRGTRTRLAQRHRLQEILVLVFRCLLLLLLVLALARPSFQAGGGSGGAATDLIVILDNSASMSRPAGESTAFVQAIAMTKECIQGLSQGSRAAVVTVVPGRTPLPAGLQQDTPSLLAAVDRLKVLDGQGSLSGAIMTVAEILASSSAPNKEIVIISDLQASQFQDQRSLTSAMHALPADARVILADTGGAPVDANMGIRQLSFQARGAIVGQETSVTVSVHNDSGQATQTVVTLSLDSGKRMQQEINVPAGGDGQTILYFPVEQPGTIRGEISISADGFAKDNRAYLTLEARDQLKVLIVTNQENPILTQPENLYLCAALDPTADGTVSGCQATLISTSGLGGTLLDSYDAVMLHDAGPLSQSGAARLTRFVENGGGLWIFPGSAAQTKSAQFPEIAEPQGMLPATYKTTDPVKLKNRSGMRVHDPNHFLFEGLWADTPKTKDIWVDGLFELQVQKDAQVLLETSEGRPLLVYREFEQGHVCLSALSATTAESNWVLRPVFLGMLHNWMQKVAREGQQSVSITAGEPLTLGTRYVDKAIIYGPEGVVLEADVRKGKRLSFKQTGLAGIYRIEYDGGNRRPYASGRLVQSFSIQPDSRESALRTLSLGKAKNRLGGGGMTTVSSHSSLHETLAGLRTGREFFGLLIFLGLMVLLAETILSNLSVLGRLDPFKAKLNVLRMSLIGAIKHPLRRKALQGKPQE